MSAAGTTLIRYPRLKELHQAIQLCAVLSEAAGEPQCMALMGVTGAGKSTVARTYAQAFPRTETNHGARIPVVYLETPSPATIKSVAATALRQLGDPRAASGTLWSMDARLVHFLRECQVRLVIMDDFHHLFDEESQEVMLRAAYDPNYDRLAALKARYDPTNLFRMNLNIAPASPAAASS